MRPPAPDVFAPLRATTPARIGLGRSGDALPTAAQLDLQDAHARARDAVHGRVDPAALARALQPWPTIIVRSRAPDRAAYLRRPDLGRAVAEEDAAALDAAAGRYDLVAVIADGLSASAVSTHAVPTLDALRRALPDLSLGPAVIATQARVALGDEIGERLGARAVAVLIGERPGLSVSDSLGIYVTHEPRRGRLDSERNCISNIHARGLSHDAAAALLARVVRESRRLGRTGIDLKLDAPAPALPPGPRR